MNSYVSTYLPSRRRLRRRRGGEDRPSPLHHPIAARAGDLARAIATGAIPPRWRAASFADRVERIRGQLAPILNRAALAASWSAEAARRLDAGDDVDPVGPLEVAYAVRWLELATGGRERKPAWAAWLDRIAD